MTKFIENAKTELKQQNYQAAQAYAITALAEKLVGEA